MKKVIIGIVCGVIGLMIGAGVMDRASKDEVDQIRKKAEYVINHLLEENDNQKRLLQAARTLIVLKSTALDQLTKKYNDLLKGIDNQRAGAIRKGMPKTTNRSML